MEFDPPKERAGPPIEEQVDGLAAMIKAGKIRHYGLSNETAWGVCEFRRVAKELGVPGPVTIQNSYSLVSRGVDNDLAETLFREQHVAARVQPARRRHSVGQVSRRREAARTRATRCSTTRPALPQADRSRSRRSVRRARAATRASRSSQLALGYVKSRWHLGAMIVGATSVAQLEENIAAAEHRSRRFDAGSDRRAADSISQSRGLRSRMRQIPSSALMLRKIELRAWRQRGTMTLS